MAATASHAGAAVSRADVAGTLAEARARTLAILDPIPPADQRRQVSNLMSPLCWDLAHIGHHEELWLVRALAAEPPTDPRYDDVYDAFKHARRDRGSLPILDPEEARRFVALVRARTLAVLDTADLEGNRSDARSSLLTDGFVYGMVVQHEHQHDETILATIQLMEDFSHPDAGDETGSPRASATGSLPYDVAIAGGTVTIGTSAEPWAYDNERPAHEVTVPPFRIDTTAVTNRAFLAFVESGGYQDPRHWTVAGWEWCTSARAVAPQFWEPDGEGGWVRRRFGRVETLPLDEPVQHVCWYEADAFARWSGARLPTEAEWELAAEGADPAAANLWHPPSRWGPAPAATDSGGVSAAGAHQMLGNVWEWTESDFRGYPGFTAFPYREYSEVFFGSDYKVLRGGSWASHPHAVRTTFRNWDYPIRRQIFAGFRCARDA